MSAVLAIWVALALAEVPAADADESPVIEEAPRQPHTLPFFGVLVDAGAPDGIGASLVATPGRFFRLHAGGLTNGVGAGVRLGVLLVAFPRFAFRPILGVDGGYVFGGLGEWLPQLIEDPGLRRAVTGATVGFVNAQVGFELGSEHVAFVLRAGLSWVDVSLASQSLSVGDSATVSVRGIALRGFIPSARLGFIFCFD